MRKNYSREERKHQVLVAMAIAKRDHFVSMWTVSQIAKKLDISTSHHLRKIMDELVEDGSLVKSTHPYRKGWTQSWYRLNIEPKLSPIITHKVTLRNHRWGQMELSL